MSENLKVNSKTQILEFKRKHNDLVDSIPTSEDIEEIAEEVVEDTLSSVESGTIENVLGLDSEGKLVKGSVSGGKQLYEHRIFCDIGDGLGYIYIAFINDISTPYAGEAVEQTLCQTLKDIKDALGYPQFYPASVNFDDAITGTGMLGITVNVGQQTYQVSITGCLFDDNSGSPIINFNCTQSNQSITEIFDSVRTL